jgi:hypothetical protein
MNQDKLMPVDDSAQVQDAIERRVRVRYTQNLKTYCQRGTGELDQVWWLGTVRNISGIGVGLLLQRRFDPGTFLTLELENPTQTASHTVQVRVIRATTDQPGLWLMGCSFLTEMTESEVKAVFA